MAKDISLLGAVYPDVPSVLLPKDGGGTASFVDISDTTATASDVYTGKYFYTSAGVKTQGSATQATATVSGTTLILTNGFPVSLGGFNLNLMYDTGNKGYRTISGSISGNGTDQNWMWWELIPVDGFSRIEYCLQAYTTVASLMFYDSNKTKLSEIHGSGVITDSIDIPDGASYVAISCRTTVTYPGQYALMYY